MRKQARHHKPLQRRTIEDEIAHLRDLDLKRLRARWQNEFGRLAPEPLTRHLLFRIIAYKVQADPWMLRHSRFCSRLQGWRGGRRPFQEH
jgi:hypothetical protein